jgi:GNAT superfamily N-acetyltransferase
MKNIQINLIEPTHAKKLYRSISSSLREWFGIPEANQRYENGMLERTSFAASTNNEYVGLITLEFPFSSNANIYWMAVSRSHHKQGIGKALLKAAKNYCLEQGYFSLTVETLSPKQQDAFYLPTYHFYTRNEFKPLFELYTYGPDNLMIYLHLNLAPTGK